MKTILIAHNYSKKSFSIMSYELANNLASLGNHVIFISHQPYFKNQQEIIIGQGKVTLMSWTTKERPTKIKDVLFFLRIYRKYKPTLVLGHFTGSNISITLSKILSFGNAKTYAYYHTLSSQNKIDSSKGKFKNIFMYRRKRMFYKLFCDDIICPSLKAMEDFRIYFRLNKGLIVLNPMEDRFKNELKSTLNQNIIISFLGRLEPSKGIMELINAYKCFKERLPASKINLNIAGTGGLSNEIKKAVNNIPSIKFIGGLSYNQIDNYICESNYLIISSLSDNLPTVGLEALMHGKPLLISKNTGLINYLSEGKDSFSLQPTPEGILKIFQKVEKLEENNYLEMCKNARITFEKYFQVHSYCDKMIETLV